MPAALTLFKTMLDSADTAYILSPELKVVAVNAGFTRFAVENDGQALSTNWRSCSLRSVIPHVLLPFYEHGFALVAISQRVWEHDYECSSATVFRRFRMTACPAERGLLVIHSLRLETPHSREVREAHEASYLANGTLRMCAHCRRVQHRSASGRWDWVPTYLARRVGEVVHALCPPCAVVYRGTPRMRASE